MFNTDKVDQNMLKPVPIFLTAATVAAQLHFVTQIARQMSLTAKNASVVSVRAGEKAIGFKAITGFIDELASVTIENAENINSIAVELSQMAVTQKRMEDATARFESAIDADPKYVESLFHRRRENEKSINEMKLSFHRKWLELDDQLDETRKQIRSASVIATTSMVEASNAGEFKSQLEVIAKNIASSAADIAKHLGQARSLLDQQGHSIQ